MTHSNPSNSEKLLPVSVLTGFLGSGKTTVLNRLLQCPDMRRTLVLINEFGEIGLDHDLVTFSKDDVVVEMSSGCLCCTIRGDLAETLRNAPWRFARDGALWFERVVIETTGLADPAPILHTLLTDPAIIKRYRLDGVITTIDAINGSATLDRQAESVKQAAVADRLLLTKTDLADHKSLQALQARLAALNPGAPQVKAVKGAIDPSVLFEAGPYSTTGKTGEVQRWLNAEAYGGPHGATTEASEQGTAHTHSDVNRHDAHIKAHCLTIDEPMDMRALESWLAALLPYRGEDLLRVKGLVNVKGLDGPVVIHAVQHVLHPATRLAEWPSEDRRSRIVFITRDIPASELRAALSLMMQNYADVGEGVDPTDASAFELRFGSPGEQDLR